MKPKKKSSTMSFVIFGIILFFVVMFCLHGAIAYEASDMLFQNGVIEKRQIYADCFNRLLTRLNETPSDIYINQFTAKWVSIGCFAWFIIVLMLTSNKKNYIHGKEFGTARWGTQSDIRDLFSHTIVANEIKKAKQVTNPIGRFLSKRKVYKDCEQFGREELKVKLNAAKKREEERKKGGNKDKGIYLEEKKEIENTVKEEVIRSKRLAWGPDQYAYDFETAKKDIEENVLYTDEEKKVLIDDAEKQYERKVQDFFSGKNRINKIKAKYENSDILLTKTEKVCFYNYKVNLNNLIIGGSGSGKSRGVMLPNLLQGFGSYVVTDPKGELLEKTGHYLADVKGYKIKVLNLDDKTNSDGYNPFDYIHPEREGYEERVLSLIETIILNTDGGVKKDGADPFWPKAERLFLQSIFFFTVDGFIPEERNMNTVMKLIAMLDIGEEEDLRESDLDIFVKKFSEKHGKNHIGVEQFNDFRGKASGKTAKSIVISAVARLAPFRTSEVRRIFSYDTMHLERIGEEKTAVFVVVPPTDSSFNFIAGMLFTQLFQEIQYCATQIHKHDGQRLPVPVRFLMDEFANTCEVPNFVKILAYARSLGVGISIVVQSLEQLKKMYEKEWGVICDNCNELLYLGGVTSMDTLEYISKLLGKSTFDKRTTGRTRGRQGSHSENFDVIGRELMLPDEIRKMPKEDCILIIGGRNPFYSKKYLYENHPNYRYTSDGNKMNSYYFKPEVAPVNNEDESIYSQEYNQEEQFDVQDFLDEVLKEEIQIIDDPAEELRQLTEDFEKLVPLGNEYIDINDGEEGNDEQILDLMKEQSQKDQENNQNMIDSILNAVSESEVELVTDAEEELKLLEEQANDLRPLSNEYMTVDDGEIAQAEQNLLELENFDQNMDELFKDYL